LTACFLPDNSAPAPVTLDDFQSTGGAQTVQVTQPLTYVVDVNSLNKAYRVNYTKVEEDMQSTDTISSAGRFCWGVGGLTPTADATYGSWYVDYVFEFSDPKLSQSDQVYGFQAGAVALTAAAANLETHPRLRGIQCFKAGDTAGWYLKRGRQRSDFVCQSLKLDGAGATAALSLSRYSSGSDPVVVTPYRYYGIDNVGGGSIYVVRWEIPPGTWYVNLIATCTHLDFSMSPSL